MASAVQHGEPTHRLAADLGLRVQAQCPHGDRQQRADAELEHRAGDGVREHLQHVLVVSALRGQPLRIFKGFKPKLQDC